MLKIFYFKLFNIYHDIVPFYFHMFKALKMIRESFLYEGIIMFLFQRRKTPFL